jgi:hypothetical protein
VAAQRGRKTPRGGCARGGGGQGIYRSRRDLGLGRPRLGCRRRMVWMRRPRGAVGVAPIHGCQHEGKGVEVGSWACAKPWVRLPARTRPASPSIARARASHASCTVGRLKKGQQAG